MVPCILTKGLRAARLQPQVREVSVGGTGAGSAGAGARGVVERACAQDPGRGQRARGIGVQCTLHVRPVQVAGDRVLNAGVDLRLLERQLLAGGLQLPSGLGCVTGPQPVSAGLCQLQSPAGRDCWTSVGARTACCSIVAVRWLGSSLVLVPVAPAQGLCVPPQAGKLQPEHTAVHLVQP